MKRTHLVSMIFASVFGLAALYAPQALAAEKVNFRLDWSVYGTHAPFFLALERGLYADEGLDVSISEGQGVTMQLQLISQGSDPIGFVDFPSTIRGIEQDMPVKAVAGIMDSIFVLIAHEDTPIKSPKDLEGKVIAMAPAESSAQLMTALMAAHKIDNGKISVLSPAVGAKNALFLQRRADVIPAAINVQVAQLEAQGEKIQYVKFSDFGIRTMNHGIVVNTNYLAEKGDVVRAFLRATSKAFEMARKDPDAAVDAIIARMPQLAGQKDVLKRQLALSFDAMIAPVPGKPAGWMSEAAWQSTADILQNYGGVARKQPLGRYFTNDYLTP